MCYLLNRFILSIHFRFGKILFFFSKITGEVCCSNLVAVHSEICNFLNRFILPVRFWTDKTIYFLSQKITVKVCCCNLKAVRTTVMCNLFAFQFIKVLLFNELVHRYVYGLLKIQNWYFYNSCIGIFFCLLRSHSQTMSRFKGGRRGSSQAWQALHNFWRSHTKSVTRRVEVVKNV